MVADYTGLSTVRSKNLLGLGLDEPLSIDQVGSLCSYHQDCLGSVNELSDASGTVARTHRYDSFGKITSQRNQGSEILSWTRVIIIHGRRPQYGKYLFELPGAIQVIHVDNKSADKIEG